MRKIITYILISLITNFAFSQKEDKKENKDNKDNKETQNTKVTPGASGVKRSIGYRFSSATGDADPGRGIFRYNNSNASDVSYIFVDDNDIKGEDQNKWYRTWEDSTGASGRGQILVVKLNGEVVNIFDFTDVFTDGNGYWKFPVEYVSGTMPANDSVYYYIFNRIAHGRGEEVEEVEKVEGVEEVEEAEEVIAIAEVPAPAPEPTPEPEPVVAEVKVEEVPVVVVAAEVPEPVVAEVKVEEAPVVVAVAEVPAAEPVVEVKVEEAPVVVAVAEVPAAEPVVEVKVEEAPVVVVAAEVPAAEPVVEVKIEEAPVAVAVAEVPAAEPVVEVKVEEAPVVVAVAEVPAAEPVVEVKIEEAPVVVAVAEVPAAEPVVEVIVEEAPVVVAVAEVPAAEPVVEVKVEEAPVVVVAAEVSAPEPVAAEEKVTELPKITERKTRVPPKPLEAPETKPDTGGGKVLPEKPDEGVQTTVPEPKKETIVDQGPPRVTETKPAEPPKAPAVAQTVPPVPEPKPAQTTTTAAGPPRVTETKPAAQTQGTTVAQGTQKPPVAPPAQETRPAAVYQPAIVDETPVTGSYTGSSGRVRGKCYRGIIELGYGLKVSEYGMNNFRFNFINGFNIRNTSVGLGIGVRKFYDKPAKHPDWHLVSGDVQIPVFLDVRTHFSSKKVTPYLGIGLGNSTTFDSDTTNNKPEGLYFHTTGGIWFNLSDRFAVFAGLAYETQKLRFADFDDEIIYNRNTNSLSLNIGIAF